MMKKKEAIVTEPEMVYARATTAAPAARGVLMQYIVPKKDQSFLEDMAQVRGWKNVQKMPAKRSAHLDESLRQIANGEYFEASSAEEMCEQILGKGRRKNHVPNSRTERAMKEALEDMKAGRVHQYDSVDDMFDQILGKGWKAKTKTGATAKKSLRASAPTKKLSRLEEAIQQVERGEVFSAVSVDDMFDQILGKGWRTK